MKKKFCFTALIVFFTGCIVAAQPYRTSLGAIYTAGKNQYNGIGPVLKLFFSQRSAGEASVYFNKGGYHASLLYQYHFPLDAKKNFNCYAGAGVYNIIFPRAVIGFEYKFANAPFSISTDWRPYYLYFSDDDIDPNEGWQQFGLSLKYIIKKSAAH